MTIIIGIAHGYYAMKNPHVCFPTGLSAYAYELYTMQNVLQYQGKYYVCGTGRQMLQKDKTANDYYYLLTMTAISQGICCRKEGPETSVVLAVGLPLASFGREIVNTIEGNSGDKVARRSYSIGSTSIYGYGVPAY